MGKLFAHVEYLWEMFRRRYCDCSRGKSPHPDII